ncbi:hypothetical protein QAD02_004686 [Eretmocerus hayati]|uniref:Uncharacterized protein n=1 Tax=Eretmocerus hayati TaxID=131215 RepID=A0ACC2NQQ0_9HYME|nr:hypothetical protein QAD02_004686 [Eretmocerus hayati]
MSSIYIQEPPTSGKVVMKTTVGDIDLELWTKEAPKACRNFIQLCMEGYYDNTIFHRVVKGFIVQGGDPTGTGEGGESIYGEPFKDEFHQRLRFCRRGLVAMANAGKDDNSSQFFFTLAATPELQNKHTIFGKVTGETIYNMIKLEDALVDENDRPIYTQKILKTQVLSNPFEDIVPRTVGTQKSDEGKSKKKTKKGVKDFKLLSFGEEAEEDEEESVVLSKQLGTKSKSAHDNLSDPKLSSQPAIETDDPPQKKFKGEDSDSGSDDSEKSDGEEVLANKEKKEMTDKIREKLKKTNKEPPKKEIETQNSKLDESDEEEYYFGKDKDDERKKQTEKIKKEIRDLKRGMRNEQNKKLEDEKEKKEKEKKKEIKSELVKEYHETQDRYKEEHSKLPKKGASRDDFTQKLLSKFYSKLSSAREQQTDNDDAKSKETNNDDDDDDDPNDPSWMTRSLRCEDNAPVLAKDASTKGDDWFEIYDPRNPINKRRRGETSDKSKGDKFKKR